MPSFKALDKEFEEVVSRNVGKREELNKRFEF